MSNPLSHFLGDSVGKVVIKLLILSLLVGIILNALGWTPMDVVDAVINSFKNLWHMGFSSFRRLFDILLVGAAIVVPIFIILRLLSLGRRR